MTDYARDPNNLTPPPDERFPASDLSEYIEAVDDAVKVFAERIQIINLPSHDDAYLHDMGFASTQELPGAWDASDFLGGVDEVRGADWVAEEVVERVKGVVTGGRWVDPNSGARYWWLDDSTVQPSPEPLGPDWQDLGYTSEDEPRPVGYDGQGAPIYSHQIEQAFPRRWIAGMDQDAFADAVHDGDGMVAIDWRQPTTLTIDLRNVHVETMELLAGMSLIPLCDRRLPAEGQE